MYFCVFPVLWSVSYSCWVLPSSSARMRFLSAEITRWFWGSNVMMYVEVLWDPGFSFQCGSFVYLVADNNNKSNDGSCLLLSPYRVAGTVLRAVQALPHLTSSGLWGHCHPFHFSNQETRIVLTEHSKDVFALYFLAKSNLTFITSKKHIFVGVHVCEYVG